MFDLGALSQTTKNITGGRDKLQGTVKNLDSMGSCIGLKIE